jgi:hypothetical protein
MLSKNGKKNMASSSRIKPSLCQVKTDRQSTRIKRASQENVRVRKRQAVRRASEASMSARRMFGGVASEASNVRPNTRTTTTAGRRAIGRYFRFARRCVVLRHSQSAISNRKSQIRNRYGIFSTTRHHRHYGG